MTGIGVGPNTPDVLAVVGALGTDAGPLPHPAASSAKEAPAASRVMTFLVIEGMWPSTPVDRSHPTPISFFFVYFVYSVSFVAGLEFGEAPIMSPRGSTW